MPLRAKLTTGVAAAITGHFLFIYITRTTPRRSRSRLIIARGMLSYMLRWWALHAAISRTAWLFLFGFHTRAYFQAEALRCVDARTRGHWYDIYFTALCAIQSAFCRYYAALSASQPWKRCYWRVLFLTWAHYFTQSDIEYHFSRHWALSLVFGGLIRSEFSFVTDWYHRYISRCFSRR